MTRVPPTLLPRARELPAGSPDGRGHSEGARTWLAATVSLILAANVMFSRYLFADSLYDLYAGRYIVHHGIPERNVITAAAHGTPWTDQQWLAHVLYYAAWSLGGYRLLAAFSAALVTSGFALLAVVMLRRGVPGPRVFLWTVAAFGACMGNTGIRAQSFAYPCLALVIWLILDDSRAPRLRARTALVIAVLLLWANTHGSVLMGAGLVGLYAMSRAARAVRRRDRRDVLASAGLGAAAGAAVVCTPYGVGVLRYYRLFIGNPVLSRNIVEWAPPSPLDPFSWGFFALLLMIVAALVLAWRRGTRPDPQLLVLSILLLGLALTAVRDQAWFAVGGSLLAADTLARGDPGRPPQFGRAFRRVTTVALATLAAAAVITLSVTPVSQFESELPVGAINAAAAIAVQHPAVRIIGDDWSGTAMLWLHPRTVGRVGFDIRIEQYSPAQMGAYFDFLFVRGAGWARVMRGYGIAVVSGKEHPALASALAQLPGWRVVYRDRAGLVLERAARS